MSSIKFNTSQTPTLGVEVELAMVDAETMKLCHGNPIVLEAMEPRLEGHIKPELMQSYVEVNTGINDTVADADADLRDKLVGLERLCDQNNMRLLWSGTHPFSSWRHQKVTQNERYEGLVELMQDTARQLVTFGLHVHVGVDSGDKAVMICDRILSHMPTLLAASCNSPFWEGRDTGLCSWRSKIMDGLPTAGLPPLMRNWSEYVWLVNHLVDTGFIESIREIWWDVRPHHNFGTVEVRICDVPANFDDAMALTALIQCLIKSLSDEIDEGTYQHDCHPMLVRQNKWRAARYGLDAELVQTPDFQLMPARDVLRRLVEQVRSEADVLGCRDYLERVMRIADQPSAAHRQRDLLAELGDPVQMVRALTEATRLTRQPA